MNRTTFRLPLGFLGMLPLVLVAELAIAGRHLDFTTVWAEDWRRSAHAATAKVRDRDVLCFGDSLVKFGVLPRQIEARTGLKSFNLALNAGTMPSSYFLLRKSLESGAKPRAIVVDFFALMQPDRPDRSIRLYPDLATSRECFELAWISGDLAFLSATMLGKFLPSYKCRYEIRDHVVAAFEGHRAGSWVRLPSLRKSWKAEDGAQPMTEVANRPGGDLYLINDICPTSWECDPVNAAYMEKFLALAESREIPVFWLMPPLSFEAQAWRALKGTDEIYSRFARTVLERHPGVVVLDGRRAGYEDSVYVDTIHLDHRGAEVLTDDLAAALADRLKSPASTPRWVNLPPFAGRSMGIARAGSRR